MEAFVTVPGGRLYSEIDGSGPPLLLLHAGVANLRMWDPHVPDLAARHTVIRYDARGYGRSETAAVDFSNRADAVAVLDHAGVDLAILVGASRGGIIALDTVLEHPARAAGLVSVAGGISGYEPSASSLPMDRWEEAEAHWKEKHWDWLADFETRIWVDGPGQPEDRAPAALRDLVHGWIVDTYRAEKEEGSPQPLDPPAAGRLAEVACPVLVMIGGLDEAGTVESCRKLAASVPGSEVAEFPDAAHMLNLEHPERFTETLLAFARRVYG